MFRFLRFLETVSHLIRMSFDLFFIAKNSEDTNSTRETFFPLDRIVASSFRHLQLGWLDDGGKTRVETLVRSMCLCCVCSCAWTALARDHQFMPCDYVERVCRYSSRKSFCVDPIIIPFVLAISPSLFSIYTALGWKLRVRFFKELAIFLLC